MTRGTTGFPRDRWRITDVVLSFPAGRLTPGEQHTGRLVRVRVESPVKAVFSARPELAGSSLGLPALAHLAGEAEVRSDGLRVTVSAPALSVLVVGALAGVFVLGGLELFLSHPRLGTAMAGGALALVGSWLLRQVPKAGREVAADAARALAATTLGPR